MATRAAVWRVGCSSFLISGIAQKISVCSVENTNQAVTAAITNLRCIRTMIRTCHHSVGHGRARRIASAAIHGRYICSKLCCLSADRHPHQLSCTYSSWSAGNCWLVTICWSARATFSCTRAGSTASHGEGAAMSFWLQLASLLRLRRLTASWCMRALLPVKTSVACYHKWTCSPSSS